MAGGCVPQNAFFQIHEEIGGSDEVLLEFAAQSVVEACEDAGGIIGMRGLRGGSNLQHGSDKRGGNAVAGDVRDKNAEPLFVNGKKIIEISSDGAHRRVAGSDVQPEVNRHTLRTNGGLNPAGDFEFLIDGEEPLFVRKNAV